jgi:hypothetical protein
VPSLRRPSPLSVSVFGLWLGLADVSCRRFELCGASSGGCTTSAAGGDSGDAGAAGAASGGAGEAAGTSGSGGTLSCVEPILSCDESVQNGCETDTRVEPLHCGRCGNACSACGSGRCLTVDRFDDHEVVIGGGIAVSTDYVYFLANSPSTQQTVLRRMAKANGEVTTLLEGLSRYMSGFRGMAVGLDRIYLVDDGELRSVSFTEPSLHDERVVTEMPPVVNGEYLYVWKTTGALLRRNLTSGLEEELAPWPPETASSKGHLALLDDKVVVGSMVMRGSEDDWGWELRIVDWPASERIASGEGGLARVRTFPTFDFDVVWLVDHSDSGGGSELRGVVQSDTEYIETLIAVEDNFTDFCLSERLIYANVDRKRYQGIRALSRSARPYADIGLRQQISDPMCDGASLYFFDLAAPGLYRLNVGDLEP